ncbi:hypothetical protein ABH980_006109 [Bradyrhizobium ottawaense]
MSSRLLQNFKGGRAIVVTRRGGWESALETTLAKLGVSTEYPEIIDGRAQIDVASLQAERDILFIDGDLEGAVAIEVNPGSRLPPVPVDRPRRRRSAEPAQGARQSRCNLVPA